MREDIKQALEKFKIKTFGNQKNIERVEKKLNQNEIVKYIAPTNATIYQTNTKKKEKLPGIIVLTSERVLFSYKAGFSEATETFKLSEVNSMNCSGNGLTGGHIEIHTLTKTLDVLVSYKKDLINQLQEMIEETVNDYKQKLNAPQVQFVQQNDVIEQIQKLSDLKEKGILTEEEFQSKKKDLLSKI